MSKETPIKPSAKTSKKTKHNIPLEIYPQLDEILDSTVILIKKKGYAALEFSFSEIYREHCQLSSACTLERFDIFDMVKNNICLSLLPVESPLLLEYFSTTKPKKNVALKSLMHLVHVFTLGFMFTNPKISKKSEMIEIAKKYLKSSEGKAYIGSLSRPECDKKKLIERFLSVAKDHWDLILFYNEVMEASYKLFSFMVSLSHKKEMRANTKSPWPTEYVDFKIKLESIVKLNVPNCAKISNAMGNRYMVTSAFLKLLSCIPKNKTEDFNINDIVAGDDISITKCGVNAAKYTMDKIYSSFLLLENYSLQRSFEKTFHMHFRKIPLRKMPLKTFMSHMNSLTKGFPNGKQILNRYLLLKWGVESVKYMKSVPFEKVSRDNPEAVNQELTPHLSIPTIVESVRRRSKEIELRSAPIIAEPVKSQSAEIEVLKNEIALKFGSIEKTIHRIVKNFQMKHRMTKKKIHRLRAQLNKRQHSDDPSEKKKQKQT